MTRVANTPRRNRTHVRRDYPVIRAECTATAAVSAAKLRVTFSARVVVKGIPAITVNGSPATAVAVVSPTQVDLTYAAPVAAGQAWLAPAQCAGLRTESGGYILRSTGTL